MKNVAQWDAYVKDFQAREQQGMQEVAAAQEALTQAKLHLEETRKAASQEETDALADDVEDDMQDEMVPDSAIGKQVQEFAANLALMGKQAQEAVAASTYGPARQKLSEAPAAPYAEAKEDSKSGSHFS